MDFLTSTSHRSILSNFYPHPAPADEVRQGKGEEGERTRRGHGRGLRLDAALSTSRYDGGATATTTRPCQLRGTTSATARRTCDWRRRNCDAFSMTTAKKKYTSLRENLRICFGYKSRMISKTR